MKRAMFTVLPFSFLLACTGPLGPMGDKGDKGDKGVMGDKGAMGDKGTMGDTGATGAFGPRGLNCWDVNENGQCDMDPEGVNEDVDGNERCDVFDCRGNDGAPGPKGDRGDPGANGADGAKGDKGDRGDTGAPGAPGAPGADGAKGDKGDKGDRGDTGADGAQGPQGDKGDKGDRGDTGPQGTFTAGACTFTTGQLVAGTNAQGESDTSSVTCPVGAFAVGIFPVQQAWNPTSTCVPISFRVNNRTVSTDWFSTPRGIGTGCLSNSFATATLCCQ